MEHLLRPTKYAQNQPHARFFVTSALLSSGLASGVSCHWASPNAWLANEEAAGLNGDFSTDVHAAVNYKSTIARLLKEQKFQELDYLADRARSGKRKISWRELETRQSGVFLETAGLPHHCPA
jgi:hypothetical protein